MTQKMGGWLAIAAAILGMKLLAQPAGAACFESGVGCPDDHYIAKSVLNGLSCDALWTVRNSIYNERGLCFKSARAIEAFSNEDCSITDPALITFNAYERANIDRIVAAERRKGCR